VRAVLLLWLVGCNQVYGLDRTEAADAAPPEPDKDEDGIPDVRDNCLDVKNADQHDEDKDTIGDACDNCPLIANSGQEHDGDTDLVGDACDPNPTAAIDCLAIFDSFRDPSQLAQHWTAAGITSGADFLELGQGSKLVARDLTGDVFSVQAKGTLDFVSTSGALTVATNLDAVGSAPTDCAIGSKSNLMFSVRADVGSQDQPLPKTDEQGLSTVPVAKLFALRMTAFDSAPYGGQFGSVRCRAEYGVAIGLAGTNTSFAMNRKGSPGVLADKVTAQLEGVAIYSVVAFDAPCPPATTL
jgi:hypothetical protein